MVDIDIEDLAVIFEPVVDNEGIRTYYPVEIVEGFYDEISEKFIDENLYSYDHFMDFQNGKSFALRGSILKAYKNNPDKSLSEIKKEYLENLRKYEYTARLYDCQVILMRKPIDSDNSKATVILDQDSIDRCMFFFNNIEDIKEFEEQMNKKINEDFDDDIENKIEEETNNNDTLSNTEIKISPRKLYKEIRKTVIGQDDAIKQIVTTIWENFYGDTTNNMIILGPSGSGKTEIIRQVSKLLNIPLLLTSVTGMSQAGYIGRGTDEILKDLLTLTKGDISKAERAIVVLDEFDKIATRGNKGDISTNGVQNELLKIVEDGTFGIDYNHGSRMILNTEHITFIGVGACTDILTKKINKQAGFTSDIKDKVITTGKINADDLVEKLGLKAELVGRMGKIIRLNDLDIDTLKKIITDSKKSAYNDKVNLIKKSNVKYIEENHDEIIETIAKIAKDKKIGARAISSIVNEMFSDIMFNLSDDEENYNELTISKDTVTDPKKYMLRK